MIQKLMCLILVLVGDILYSGDFLKFHPYALEMSNFRKKYIKSLGIRTIDYKNIYNYQNFFHYIRLDQVVEHVSDIRNLFNLLKKIAMKDLFFVISSRWYRCY